ncbi:MAG TPA: P-loop NTPase, partial [Ignavibacteria bacterium]|nr:P-loop NTPase [Ignavibacteria bacterium]
EAVVWRGPMAASALKQFMSDVEWDELDFLLYDMPPGTGDIQLTLTQSLPLTGAVIVTTPQEISLIDARKGAKMFEKVNVPVLGIIENMSYYSNKDGSKEYIFGEGGGRKLAEEMKLNFLGEIAINTDVRIGGDKGKPIVLGKPDSKEAEQFTAIAKNLAGDVISKAKLQPKLPVIEI